MRGQSTTGGEDGGGGSANQVTVGLIGMYFGVGTPGVTSPSAFPSGNPATASTPGADKRRRPAGAPAPHWRRAATAREKLSQGRHGEGATCGSCGKVQGLAGSRELGKRRLLFRKHSKRPRPVGVAQMEVSKCYEASFFFFFFQ